MKPTGRSLAAAIFDVDGVPLAYPHEQARREALEGFTEPERLTTDIYEAHVAGKPWLNGAWAVLQVLGVQAVRDLGWPTAVAPLRIMAHLERNGVPVDAELGHRLMAVWPQLLIAMLRDVNAQYGVYKFRRTRVTSASSRGQRHRRLRCKQSASAPRHSPLRLLPGEYH
jgi:hypothetical protein